MMMDKKITTGVVVALIIGIIGIVFIGSKSKTSSLPKPQYSFKKEAINSTISDSNQEIVLFYGNTCPHCKDLENWMEENGISEKLEIIKKEVYENKDNAIDLNQAALNCGLQIKNIGVPFLYTPENKCLIGTPDIMDYLMNKASLVSEGV